MENSQAMIEEKRLGFFDLLKESLKIPIRNPNFIIFAFFSSLPLFSFLIMTGNADVKFLGFFWRLVAYSAILCSPSINLMSFNKTVFQQTMIKILKYISQERTDPFDVFVYYYETLEAKERLVEEISTKFLLCFIYLGILHLLDLFNMITMVDIASMIYKGDQKSMNLKNMLSRCIKETRLKGPLITSIYALLLDSLVSVGLVSMVMYICLGSISSFFSNMVFSVVFLGLLSKYIEWSAVWNMGILISILEDKHGDVALIISAYRTRGSRQHGFLLMLVFFGWRLALRSAFIYVGWDGGGRGVAVTIVHASLVCSAKMWLWLVFIVYFYDCQKKSLRRKNDVEGGQEET